MRAETRQIIAEVEQVSGFPVQTIAVPELGMVARITTSPHITGSYLIQYRAGIPFKDYAVAFQCGHVLRLLSLPESERLQFATTDATTQWAV
ncbi:MAG TPA: hypothetical protein PLS53_15095, partial [Thermoanaerobaculaceae bacterium]|nr:hypothetical protein [Thermoanaerobaculaceae bacterium]